MTFYFCFTLLNICFMTLYKKYAGFYTISMPWMSNSMVQPIELARE